MHKDAVCNMYCIAHNRPCSYEHFVHKKKQKRHRHIEYPEYHTQSIFDELLKCNWIDLGMILMDELVGGEIPVIQQ